MGFVVLVILSGAALQRCDNCPETDSLGFFALRPSYAEPEDRFRTEFQNDYSGHVTCPHPELKTNYHKSCKGIDNELSFLSQPRKSYR